MLTYKNAALSVDQRVEDLLARMTLGEKVAQLGSVLVNDMVDSDNRIVESKLVELLQDGCGQISRSAWMLGDIEPKDAVQLVNEIQRYLMNNTRLGIPAILHEECLNGVQVKNATAFPQSIGVASTWNGELVRKMGDVLKKQMRAGGATQGLAPVLDIVRDARWGRVEETYGEDPYLTSTIGTAYVKGLQGDNLKEGVLATAKHFIGYGASEGGLNWAPVHINKRESMEVYGRPFEAAIREANLGSVMNSYTEIDGVVCAFSKELLTDTLRDEFGFDGIVVSDYGAIDTASKYHRASPDLKDAGIQALMAGLDVELPFTKCYGSNLIEAVEVGKISLDIIDCSVRRVLTKKFQLGLFENPFGYPDKVNEIYRSREYKQIARQVARESIILLKNESRLLPLSKNLKSLAIIGPNADSVRNLLGDYNYASGLEGQVGMYESFNAEVKVPETREEIIKGMKQYEGFVLERVTEMTGTVYRSLEELSDEILMTIVQRSNELSQGEDSQKKLKVMIELMKEKGLDSVVKECNDIMSVREAIQAMVSEKTQIHYAKGCEIIGGSDDGFEEAVHAAKKSEVAIVVMGDKSGLDAGSTTGESRDRADLNLPGAQLELLKELHTTGTPIVLVLINGRPISSLWENDNIPAILEGWLPGEQGAEALAEVLFGDYNPGGKLPISVPKSVGQVPIFYNHKPSGGRSHWQGDYVEMDTKPLYEFGFGLSYTAFEYKDLIVDKSRVDSNDRISVSVIVRNIGDREGDEVVQLYMNNLSSSVTRPVKQLYGFKRITLNAGAKAKVTFSFPVSLLGFYNREMKYVLEPGEVKIFIGSSSADIGANAKFDIDGDGAAIVSKKCFFSDSFVEYLG